MIAHRPFWWDRQAEHDPVTVICCRQPIYWSASGRILARYYDDYVRNGHALAGEPLDHAAAALDAMRDLIEAERNWVASRLERGQLLYVNNRQIAHSRTAFRDDDARRHLRRLWNRDEGTPDLDGGRSEPTAS